MLKTIRSEWSLAAVWGSALIWMFAAPDFSGPSPSVPLAFGGLIWICTAILFAAFAVVRHADVLAERYGEPYGTMILTFSVISLEVLMIAALMLQGDQPALARDTVYSVVMIVLTGLVGICLLVGGIKFHEQSFNLKGASSYLAMILPLACIGLILPEFTKSGPFKGFSNGQAIGLTILSASVYAVFLVFQTTSHRKFFVHDQDAPTGNDAHQHASPHSTWWHVLLLLAYIVPVVILAKRLAAILDFGTDKAGLPVALGGLIVAALILAPEGLTAVQSAGRNQLQRSVNLLLGSVLATIGLTIPAALLIGLFTGQDVILGLDMAEVTLLVVVLALSMLTFGQGRTNMLHGAIHFVLFGVYLFLVFD